MYWTGLSRKYLMEFRNTFPKLNSLWVIIFLLNQIEYKIPKQKYGFFVGTGEIRLFNDTKPNLVTETSVLDPLASTLFRFRGRRTNTVSVVRGN